MWDALPSYLTYLVMLLEVVLLTGIVLTSVSMMSCGVRDSHATG